MNTEGTGAPETTDLRCSGHCCKSFAVEVIDHHGGLDICKLRHAAGTLRFNEDQQIVLDMLVEQERKAVDPQSGRELAVPMMFYGCRHWNEQTGNCGIYESRPQMCRGYPYRGTSCEYKGCTFRRAPEKPVTIQKDTDQPTETA